MPLLGSASSSGRENPSPKPEAPIPGVAGPEGVDDDAGEDEEERLRSFSLK